jgi:cupin fold WbuC family metalloprotein
MESSPEESAETTRQEVMKFSPEFLRQICIEAVQSPRLRQHRNIHENYNEPCQRLFNAIRVDSYIRPHRHSLDQKSELLLAVQGVFALLTFDAEGTVREVIGFGTERYLDRFGFSVGVELRSHVWHTVISLMPESILLEIKAGPFVARMAKEAAPWAPDEGNADASEYFNSLRALAKSRLAYTGST